MSSKARSLEEVETPWAVMRGVYKRGIVEPLESVPYQEGVQVLILFPKRISPTGTEGVWQRTKRQIAEEMPDLLSMTESEKRKEFDRLSSVIAERTSYHSPEEFERAMRGDDYGLVGH